MDAFVTAILVSHDADDYFAVTAEALQSQTRKPDRILVIDSGTSDFAKQLTKSLGFDHIQIAHNSTLHESVMAAIEANNVDGQWLWLLHDDSAPEPEALVELLAAIERAPSAAIAGPKLVQWQDPRFIRQLGLTLTPLGELFSPINSQFDQGQNDDLDDVMAVGTAAMLIRAETYQQLGGFDNSAPLLAADIDLSIRTRLAGHRVIVAPKARVRHAELSLHGQRERKWLGATPKTAIKRASIQLRLTYSPLAFALIFWLLLPFIGLIRTVSQVARKHPELIWVEFSSSIWGFFTVVARLRARRNISRSQRAGFRELRPLRATWSQVRNQRRTQREHEESLSNPYAFERGDIANLTGINTRGFLATGGLWWFLALAAFSYAWWPRDIAVTAGGLLPLSSNWWDVFIRAGASYQPIGLGFFAPSDPFAWVLTVLGATTFWAPSLSLAILLLLVKPLAFLGAWKLAAQVTEATWLRVLSGLAFALWPALGQAQLDGRLTAIVAGLCLPWFVLAILRVAQLGKVPRSSAQSWTWVAIAGLLLAAIGAAVPNVLPLLFIGLAFTMLVRVKRLGYLIWVPLPLAAIFSPTVVYYMVTLGQPLALLADPGLAQGSGHIPFLSLEALIASAPFLLFALLALIRNRIGISVMLWVFILLEIASAYLISSINFPAVGVGQVNLETVNGSPATLLIAVGSTSTLLLAIALDGIRVKRLRQILVVSAVVLTLGPTIALSVISQPHLKFSDSRVVPAIIAAEVERGSKLKFLVLTPSTDASGKSRLAAELVAGNGVHLEDMSLAYRFSIASLASQKYAGIAQLVADLASANGTPRASRLKAEHIGYVIVPSGNSDGLAEIGIALDSAAELEAVGLTDFGRLWRVRETPDGPADDSSSPWSITKAVQVAILISFALMAIPSRATKRKGAEEIFIDATESGQ